MQKTKWFALLGLLSLPIPATPAPIADCRALTGTDLTGILTKPSVPVTSPQSIDCSVVDPQGQGVCRDNWGLDRIDQTAPRGATSRYLFGRTGAGVYVYVVDSGVTDNHDEFLDMRLPAGMRTSRVLPGRNTANNTDDTKDCISHGHGTHVASIIAGNSSGVAKNAWIVPVRYFGAGAPGVECTEVVNTPASLEAAFNWILWHHQLHPGPAVVNLSSNDTDWRTHPTLRQAVRGLLDAGITLIQAASNEDDLRGDACAWTFVHPEIPRSGVVVVGGTEAGDTRWHLTPGTDAPYCHTGDSRPDCGSNSGPCVDLWAPAAQIVAASKRATNGFCRLSGTSMAAPHATGVAALFLEGHPNVPPAAVETALTMAATRSALDTSIGDSLNLLLSSNLPESAGAVAVDDQISYAPGTPKRVLFEDLLDNDFAWNGSSLQVTAVTPPVYGTLVQDSLGFTYTPSAAHETESFSYEVLSGSSSVASASITMTVARPFAVDDHFTQFEGEDFSFSLSKLVENDVAEGGLSKDETADLVFVGFVRLPTTGTLSAVSGSPDLWSFHPGAGFAGRDSASYQVRNPAGVLSEGTVYFSSYTSSQHGFGTESVGDLRTTRQGQATTFDPVGNDKVKNRSVELVANPTQPHHGTVTVNLANGTVTYQPNAGFAGFDSFTYLFRTFDSSHVIKDVGAGSVLVEVQPVPPGPVARPDFLQAERNTQLAIGYAGLLANDNGSGLTFRTDLFTNPAHGTLDFCCSGNAFKYNPDPGYVGADSFRYAIEDNLGHPPVSAVVTIDVVFNNHSPVANPDSAVTEHDAAINLPVLANDSDPDGDSLTVTGLTQPASGSAVINGGSTITYTPPLGFTGTVTFTYTVQDSNSSTATATVTVRVRAQNVPPVAVDNPFSSPRNSPFSFTCVQLLANDSDSDAEPALGDHLTVTSVGTASAGTLVCTACSCTLTPPAGFTGLINVPYAISDGRPGGTANAFARITVFNRAPVAVNDVAATPQSTPVTVNVRANDSDPDGDAITVNAITAQPAAGTGTCAVASGGTGVVYTPPAGFMTQTTCSYTVTDGLASSAPATITLYINRPPLARGDQIRIPFATPTQIARATLLANDFDPDGDTLTISSFDTTGMNGTLSCPVGGTSCTYTPPGGSYTAVTTFKYTATDGRNGFSTATVKLKVGVVQSLPVANDDLLTTPVNTAKAFTVLDVLANDTDADSDVLTAGIISGARDFGTLSCSTPSFTCAYTPNTGFVGMDRFSYTASDGADGSATASIKMMVLPSATPSFDAQEDQLGTPQNTSRFFTRGGLTINDYSPTGDPLTITSFDTTGLNGTLDCTTDTFGCTYQPPSFFSGITRFKYTVSDTHGHSDTAIVKINVGTANTAPVAANDSLVTRANTPLTFSVFELLKNDADAQNDPMTVTVYPYPSHGTLSCSAPSYWCTYTPAANYTGTDSFNYFVSDGLASSNQGTVTVTVQPVLAKDAVIVSQSVPASMTAGQSYPVSLTIKNIGTVAWNLIGAQCNAFRLGAVNPYDNTTWGLSRTELPSTVAANGQVTLTFNVTAPAAPGPYNFQRRLVHECVEWFGDLSPNVTVSVRP